MAGAAWLALGLEGVACGEVQMGQTGFGSGSDAGGGVGALESGEVDVVSAVAIAAVAEAAWQHR